MDITSASANVLASQRSTAQSQIPSFGIKGNLVNNGRCPTCTLKPPCKHFSHIDDLP